MKQYFISIINTGEYVLSEMEEKLYMVYIAGKITRDDLQELLDLAAERASNTMQIDVTAKLAELEQRIAALESKGIVVWIQGVTTAKGQTVLYDIDKDGVLDYCRYDGGRASTALSPGKINGWVKTDGDGNVTHTIEKDDNNNIILVPVAQAE